MPRFPIIIAVLSAALLSTSCITIDYNKWFSSTITIQKVMDEKEKIDSTENPALKSLILKELQENLVEFKDQTVKRIINSPNVDYDFCVIVEVEYSKGVVECYLYSKDVETVSKLKAGQSKIYARGFFSKFFTSVEDSFQKLEINNTDISVK